MKLLTTLAALTLLTLTTGCAVSTPSQAGYKAHEIGKTQTLQTGTVTAKRQVTIVKNNSLSSVLGGLVNGYAPTGAANEYTIVLESKKEIVVTQYINQADKNIVLGDTVALLTSGEYNRVLLVNHVEPQKVSVKAPVKGSHKKVASAKKPCATEKVTSTATPTAAPVTK